MPTNRSELYTSIVSRHSAQIKFPNKIGDSGTMDRSAESDSAGDYQAEAEQRTTVTTDLPAVLPDDVLADVLRRLAPRSLAASRCVCKAWRDVVDARGLLRAELLPLSVAGVFINFNNYYISEFFSRPSISGKHHYLPDANKGTWPYVCDHCNGLLLVDGDYDKALERLVDYVLNPATRWCAPLPPCPPPPEEMRALQTKYLVYDPTISPHYEVFSVTRFHYKRSPEDPVVEQSEWPPSLYAIHVFSSRTGCWEERSFVREGEAAGTVADMRHSPGRQRNAVYWRGALYVHCQNDFVMRISLSDHKYQVIKPPRGIEMRYYPQFHLGKSEKGMYFASVHGRCRIRVWILDHSPCKIKWVLMHDNNLIEWLLENKLEDAGPQQRHDRNVLGPWILDDANYYFGKCMKDDDRTEALIEKRFEWMSEALEDDKSAWNSDDEYKVYDADDNMVGEKTWCSSEEALVDEKLAWDFGCDDDMLNGRCYPGYIDILGFHPYKKIIFLSESITRGLAYHLKSSKVQILGNLYPIRYNEELSNEQLIRSSFPYTPCWLRDTAHSENNLEGQLKS